LQYKIQLEREPKMKKTHETFKFDWSEKYKYYDEAELVEKMMNEWFDEKYGIEALKFRRVQIGNHTWKRDGDTFTVDVLIETKSNAEVAKERKEYLYYLPTIFTFHCQIDNYGDENNKRDEKIREDASKALERYWKENDIEMDVDRLVGWQWWQEEGDTTLYIIGIIETGRWCKPMTFPVSQ
jgi:hypothetical protein